MNDIRNDEAELLALMDVGSNSVRMNIYKIDRQTGEYSVISSSRAMLKLVSYIENGNLSRDGEGKLYSLVREYLAKANSFPCDKFIAFATASLREAKNSDGVIAKIKNGLGVDLTVISGEKEAEYDYKATCRRFGKDLADRGVVIDMGGGSTEFIAFDDRRIRHLLSLPIGALALWTKFCEKGKNPPFPTDSEIEKIKAYVKAEMRKAEPLLSFGGTAYIIGGTARAIAKADAYISGKAEDISDGYAMSDSRFKSAAEKLIADSKSGAKIINAVCPDRLTSIVSGAVAYKEIIEALGVSRVALSLSGVREGYIEEYVSAFARREFQ